jgi:hypothetical protein
MTMPRFFSLLAVVSWIVVVVIVDATTATTSNHRNCHTNTRSTESAPFSRTTPSLYSSFFRHYQYNDKITQSSPQRRTDLLWGFRGGSSTNTVTLDSNSSNENDEEELYFGYDFCDDCPMEETLNTKIATTITTTAETDTVTSSTPISTTTGSDDYVEIDDNVVVVDHQSPPSIDSSEMEVASVENNELEEVTLSVDEIEADVLSKELDAVASTEFTDVDLVEEPSNVVDVSQEAEQVDTTEVLVENCEMDTTESEVVASEEVDDAATDAASTEDDAIPAADAEGASEDGNVAIETNEGNSKSSTNDDNNDDDDNSSDETTTTFTEVVVTPINDSDEEPLATENSDDGSSNNGESDTMSTSNDANDAMQPQQQLDDEESIPVVAVEQEIFYDTVQSENDVKPENEDGFDAWEQEVDTSSSVGDNQIHYLDRKISVGSGTSSSSSSSNTEATVAAAGLKSSTSSNAVITSDIKNILMKQLKYRRNELNVMKPEIAAFVAEKKLIRPQEGIPQNWYKDGNAATARQNSNNDIIAKVTKIVIPLAIGAVALYSITSSGRIELLDDSIDKVVSMIQSRIQRIRDLATRKNKNSISKNGGSNEIDLIAVETSSFD